MTRTSGAAIVLISLCCVLPSCEPGWTVCFNDFQCGVSLKSGPGGFLLGKSGPSIIWIDLTDGSSGVIAESTLEYEWLTVVYSPSKRTFYLVDSKQGKLMETEGPESLPRLVYVMPTGSVPKSIILNSTESKAFLLCEHVCRRGSTIMEVDLETRQGRIISYGNYVSIEYPSLLVDMPDILVWKQDVLPNGDCQLHVVRVDIQTGEERVDSSCKTLLKLPDQTAEFTYDQRKDVVRVTSLVSHMQAEADISDITDYGILTELRPVDQRLVFCSIRYPRHFMDRTFLYDVSSGKYKLIGRRPLVNSSYISQGQSRNLRAVLVQRK